jgi:hypothetical protein
LFKNYKNIVLAWLFIILLSCDAPHINPLDPENPDNEFRALQGNVQTETIPRLPIKGVNVSWQNDNIVVQTNENGDFSLSRLSNKNGNLVFYKEGFLPDTQTIIWGEHKLLTVNKFLNSEPKIQSLAIYSSVKNEFFGKQVVSLYIEVSIIDEEKDVDTVFVENDDLKISSKLNEITRGYYSRKFSKEELGLQSLEELIGKELKIVVKDKLGYKFTIARSNLKRIISQIITAKSPINKEDTVSVFPTLVWNKFLVGFKFSYHVQIYSEETVPQLIWEKTNIPQDSISVKVKSPISGNPDNDYFWVIWAVDEFKNRTQSTPASFKVRP